jgi:predicted kinase
MEAILFVGIQGAGKTTFYQRYFSSTHVHISLDVCGTRHRESAEITRCLENRISFVIDNTNVRAAERARYIGRAKAAGFRVAGYYFPVELRIALARNAKREGKAKIPVPGVIGTFRRLEPPSPDEGFDTLYRVSAQPDEEYHVAPWEPPAIPSTLEEYER